MKFIRLKTNGGHHGISKAVGRVFPAKVVYAAINPVYYVRRAHLTLAGVRPMSGRDEFGFVGNGIEAETVSVFRFMWEWLRGK